MSSFIGVNSKQTRRRLSNQNGLSRVDVAFVETADEDNGIADDTLDADFSADGQMTRDDPARDAIFKDLCQRASRLVGLNLSPSGWIYVFLNSTIEHLLKEDAESAMVELMDRCAWLFATCARRACVGGISEDRRQDAYAAFIRAVFAYDVNMGAQFTTFAYMRLIKAFRGGGNNDEHTLTWSDLEASQDDDDQLPIEERLGNHGDDDRIPDLTDLRAGLTRLPREELDVICKYFGLNGQDNMTLQEIGSLHGRSAEWARLVRNRGLARLRGMLQ